jgi:hypothetical protein
MTVGRARKLGATHVAPGEKRTGKDGKKYPARRNAPLLPDPIQEECSTCDTLEDRWQHSASSFLGDLTAMRAYWSKEFGNWEKFGKPSALVSLAKQADEEWKLLAKFFNVK